VPDEISEFGTPALKRLKQIAASGGKLQGNFYFAANGTADVAGIVIHLTARDSKGAKTASDGKKLRKALKATKFSRGLVRSNGSKIRFELHSGSAGAALMKKAFKNAFTEEGVAALKQLLRKATVGAPDVEDEDADAVEDESFEKNDDELALSLEERIELDKVLGEQGSLSVLNESLRDSFLSAEVAETERKERVQQLSTELAALMRDEDLNTEEIQEARYLLAAELYTGTAPFPAPGHALTPELNQLVQAATVNFTPSLELIKAVAGYQGALSAVEGQLSSLASALRATRKAPLGKIADQGFERMLDLGRLPVGQALSRAEYATEEELGAALTGLKADATAFRGVIASHASFAAVDDNPFDVSVTSKVSLTAALDALISACD
jgi:hypothetical protein